MFLSLPFILNIPIAAIVPIIVAIVADDKAISMVLYKALRILSLCRSSIYHLKVNPCQDAMDLESLKENTNKASIGAYRNKKIKNIYTFELILSNLFIIK
ncbi:hypothetical protein D3C73_1005180 [compost metagenome]